LELELGAGPRSTRQKMMLGARARFWRQELELKLGKAFYWSYGLELKLGKAMNWSFKPDLLAKVWK